MTIEIAEMVDEFVWLLEDTADFVAGRVMAAIQRYRAQLLPPYARALAGTRRLREHSWSAPGHQGGIAFTKLPAGRAFFDFMGENLFRTDMGIERGALGSLLDHTGPVAESEKYAARVFGAHRSYSGVVGTSGSNRSIMQACMKEDDLVVLDRNCHKSIEQGLMLTGARPVYMVPTRNRYGIIGPISPSEMDPKTIAGEGKAGPLTKKVADQKPVYAVVTNSTYDGLCYNAVRGEALLGKSSDRIHMDEAWYGYARFNPMYRGPLRHARRSGAAHGADGLRHPLHAQAAGGAVAGLLHPRARRQGRDRPSSLQPSVHDAHQHVAALRDRRVERHHLGDDGRQRRPLADAGGDPRGGRLPPGGRPHAARVRARRRTGSSSRGTSRRSRAGRAEGRVRGRSGRAALHVSQEPWMLRPGDKWHGFDDIADDWCMLDPIKVSILSPGMGEDGKLEKTGVPAALVNAWFNRFGIVPDARHRLPGDVPVLDRHHARASGARCSPTCSRSSATTTRTVRSPSALPEIAAQYPDRYRKVGMRDLGDELFEYLRENRPGDLLNAAYETLPAADMTPREAYERLVAGDIELVPADKLAKRTAANAVMPYPPGIPMLMSGENFGGGEFTADRISAQHAEPGEAVPRIRGRDRRGRDDRRHLPRPVREEIAVELCILHWGLLRFPFSPNSLRAFSIMTGSKSAKTVAAQLIDTAR